MEMWERGYCEFTESDFHCSGHWGTLSSSVINKGNGFKDLLFSIMVF